MAWYDKLLEKGITVRGTVDESINDYYYFYTPKYKKNEDGSFSKTKKGELIQKKDKKGNLEYNKEADIIGRNEDAYIECQAARKGDQIFCTTASISGLHNHTYMACVYSHGRGIKTLREFYIKYIGKKEDILKEEVCTKMEKTINEKGKIISTKKVKILKKDGSVKTEMVWRDDFMVMAIEKDGRLFDIEICDEVYFKTLDIDILVKLMKVKKSSGKSKNPFSIDYLIWDKYIISKDDMQKYEDVKLRKYGKLEFGTKETINAGREIKKITTDFLKKNNIDKAKKIELRVKDNKEAIHALGLWMDLLGEIATFGTI